MKTWQKQGLTIGGGGNMALLRISCLVRALWPPVIQPVHERVTGYTQVHIIDINQHFSTTNKTILIKQEKYTIENLSLQLKTLLLLLILFKFSSDDIPTTVEMSCFGEVPWKAGVSPPSNGSFLEAAAWNSIKEQFNIQDSVTNCKNVIYMYVVATNK